MTRQEASVLTWLRSKVGRKPVPSTAAVQRPPGRHKAVVSAIGAAFRAPFTSHPVRPPRRAPLFEALEPRVLLSAELPVVPPQPDLKDAVLAAPFEFAAQAGDAPAQFLLQGFSGVVAPLPELPAQSAQVIAFADGWGKTDLKTSADSAASAMLCRSVSSNFGSARARSRASRR